MDTTINTIDTDQLSPTTVMLKLKLNRPTTVSTKPAPLPCRLPLRPPKKRPPSTQNLDTFASVACQVAKAQQTHAPKRPNPLSISPSPKRFRPNPDHDYDNDNDHPFHHPFPPFTTCKAALTSLANHTESFRISIQAEIRSLHLALHATRTELNSLRTLLHLSEEHASPTERDVITPATENHRPRRRRDNWTAKENADFLRMARDAAGMEEMALRRMLARFFAPRRTHEQCANHLRILRAQGKVPAAVGEAVAYRRSGSNGSTSD